MWLFLTTLPHRFTLPFLSLLWALESWPQWLAPLPAGFTLSSTKGVPSRRVGGVTVFSFTSSLLWRLALALVVCLRGCCFQPLLLVRSAPAFTEFRATPLPPPFKGAKLQTLDLFDKMKLLLSSHLSFLGSSDFHYLMPQHCLFVPLTVQYLRNRRFIWTLHLKQRSWNVSYQNSDKCKDYNRDAS